MSNATIRSMIILVALVVGAFAFAGLTYRELGEYGQMLRDQRPSQHSAHPEAEPAQCSEGDGAAKPW